MTKTHIVVGIDGSDPGHRALDFAKKQAKLIGDCAITLCYVIEWSPFAFQTPEENEQRHQRREEELAIAHERVLDPAIKSAKDEGFDVDGHIKHGDVSEILEAVAVEKKAAQIIIGRVGARGLRERLFGGVSGRLVATSTVPVTIIP